MRTTWTAPKLSGLPFKPRCGVHFLDERLQEAAARQSVHASDNRPVTVDGLFCSSFGGQSRCSTNGGGVVSSENCGRWLARDDMQ